VWKRTDFSKSYSQDLRKPVGTTSVALGEAPEDSPDVSADFIDKPEFNRTLNYLYRKLEEIDREKKPGRQCRFMIRLIHFFAASVTS
jgi:hypothetical protein